MWMGQETDAKQDPRLIDRLVAAGVLRHGVAGLETTAGWQEEMLQAFVHQRSGRVRDWLRGFLTGRFPEADASDIAHMARIMFFVEAREAGCSTT